LALRKRLAERLAKLPRATGETPILDQIAIPATVITVSGFNLPEAQGLLPQLQGFPSFAWGTAAGAKAGQWYAVYYPHTIKGSTPVAIGRGRLGDIKLREIVRTIRDDFTNDTYCGKIGAGARDAAKTFSPPWPLDAIWGWFCDTFVYGAFFWAWKAGGLILNILWDTFVQTQIDKVRDAVNLRLYDLYEMWGFPTNMVPTPLHIRNISDSGFEFQSYGNTTTFWFAIGKRI